MNGSFGSAPPREGSRGGVSVLLALLLVEALTLTPYILSTLAPPRGTRFVGFFYYVDDAYNYLSFVEQAQRGTFFFRNKLVLSPQQGALINLEWYLVGRLSALLGGRLILAWRVMGVAAAAALLLGIDRSLRRLGLPPDRRLPALLLVVTGGGLGGVLFWLSRDSLSSSLDLRAGLYPFLELLANPHFVLGTALLLAAFTAFQDASGPRGVALAVGLGTILGLVRPYDLVLLVAVRGLSVVLLRPVEAWARGLAPLLGLVPVVLYNYWVFYRVDSFHFYEQAAYRFPERSAFLAALGPGLVLFLALRSWKGPGGRAAEERLQYLIWLAVGASVVAFRPVHFSLQFLVGLGLPLLVLVASSLARFSQGWTLGAIVLLSPTALAVLSLTQVLNPEWYPPAGRYEAALAMQEFCREGEVALAPPDIGLYLTGLTPCSGYVSHAIAPGYADRDSETRWFYGQSKPEDREAFLEARGITKVVLPGDPGSIPSSWLGDSSPFRRITSVGGEAGRITLYERGFAFSQSSPYDHSRVP